MQDKIITVRLLDLFSTHGERTFPRRLIQLVLRHLTAGRTFPRL